MFGSHLIHMFSYYVYHLRININSPYFNVIYNSLLSLMLYRLLGQCVVNKQQGGIRTDQAGRDLQLHNFVFDGLNREKLWAESSSDHGQLTVFCVAVCR
jgi:hypothetical protein